MKNIIFSLSLVAFTCVFSLKSAVEKSQLDATIDKLMRSKLNNYKNAYDISNPQNRLDCIKKLIAAGIDVNDTRGDHLFTIENSLLHLAAIEEDINIVQLLLKNGAKVDIVNFLNATPLHYVALQDNNSENTIKIAQLLLEEDKSNRLFKIKDGLGRDPLDRALNNKNFKVAKVILHHGASRFVYNREEIELLTQEHPELGDADEYRIESLTKMEFKNSWY